MTFLLDGSVLVSLVIPEHEFNPPSSAWLTKVCTEGHGFATCPITEGTLLRLHMVLNPDPSAAHAWRDLQTIRSLPDHQSWLDNFSYAEVPHQHLHGHRQVTDAWLVELARRKGGKLATLDASLATLYPDAVELIPVFP